jgi:hypothetical protein
MRHKHIAGSVHSHADRIAKSGGHSVLAGGRKAVDRHLHDSIVILIRNENIPQPIYGYSRRVAKPGPHRDLAGGTSAALWDLDNPVVAGVGDEDISHAVHSQGCGMIQVPGDLVVTR